MACALSDTDSDSTFDPTLEEPVEPVIDSPPEKRNPVPAAKQTLGRSSVHEVSDSDSEDLFDDNDVDDTVNKEASKQPAAEYFSQTNYATSDPTPPSRLAKAETIVVKTETKPLTPCRYGLKCYRKNPTHFKEFSHPCRG